MVLMRICFGLNILNTSNSQRFPNHDGGGGQICIFAEHAVSDLVGLDSLIKVSVTFIGGSLKKSNPCKTPCSQKWSQLNKIAVNCKRLRTLEFVHNRG